MTELGQASGPRSAKVPGFVLGAGAAGVLAVAAPAAAEAGRWALVGVALAAVAAALTAFSLSDMAVARGPLSGYAHVRAVLGLWPSRVAGVFGVAGRTVAAGALAAGAGATVLPGAAQGVAIALLMAAGGLVVVRLAAPPPVLYVSIVTLTVLVTACLVVLPVAPAVVPVGVPGSDDFSGTAAAAGVAFLAFAGVEAAARPRRAGRHLAVGAGATRALLVTVFAVLYQLGGPRLAVSPAPLRDALAAADGTALNPLLALAVTAAALLALHPLLAQAGETVGEMARAGDLPGGAHTGLALTLLAVAVGTGLPADFAAALAAGLLLAYYAVVNGAARALRRGERSARLRTCCVGLGLCVVLSVNISVAALLTGAGVLAAGLGACVLWARRTASRAVQAQEHGAR